MANTLTYHTIINGSRNLVLHISMLADGSGNLSNYPLINVSDYINEGERIANSYSVMKIAGRTSVGATLQLKFGSTVGNHVKFFESTAENEFCAEWPSLTPTHPDKDMIIRATTVGFDAAADAIDLTIWLKKKIKNEVA